MQYEDDEWIQDFNKVLELREDIVTLIDEEGVAQRFEVLDIITVGEEEYAVVTPLQPIEEQQGRLEVFIFRFEEDELVELEDEQEFDAILEILQELYIIEEIQ